MQQIRLIDLCLAFEQLSKIKKPSKRVTAAMAKLEDMICMNVETMQFWTAVPARR